MKVSDKRKFLKMTQKELAEKCGLSPQYINDIEKERRNCPDIVYSVLGIIRLSAEYIEAMNGVLSDEKWRRESWVSYASITSDGEYVLISAKNGDKIIQQIHVDNMTATDWVKVD